MTRSDENIAVISNLETGLDMPRNTPGRDQAIIDSIAAQPRLAGFAFTELERIIAVHAVPLT